MNSATWISLYAATTAGMERRSNDAAPSAAVAEVPADPLALAVLALMVVGLLVLAIVMHGGGK